MNYVRTVLYAYPQLRGIENGYKDHISNQAILSHDGRVATEKLMIYLMEETKRKEKVAELKSLVDRAIENLTLQEQLLLDTRYFGKADTVKRIFAAVKAGVAQGKYAKVKPWTRRTYFRRQDKLLKKIAQRLTALGLTENTFLDEYAELDGVAEIYRYLELRGDELTSKKENALLDAFDDGGNG
jgi:hypothetical protein